MRSLVALAMLAVASPALATGKMRCDVPESARQPVERLEARLKADGWTIKKSKLDGGCYEVYGTQPDGKFVTTGYSRHGNIQFIDALYERSHDIKTISVHHESVAGFMADVYYRVSGLYASIALAVKGGFERA